jgi:hypothetical protein
MTAFTKRLTAALLILILFPVAAVYIYGAILTAVLLWLFRGFRADRTSRVEDYIGFGGDLIEPILRPLMEAR